MFYLVRGKRRLQPSLTQGCVGDPWKGVTCNAQGRKRLFSKVFDEDDDQHEDEMEGLAKIYGACSCPSCE